MRVLVLLVSLFVNSVILKSKVKDEVRVKKSALDLLKSHRDSLWNKYSSGQVSEDEEDQRLFKRSELRRTRRRRHPISKQRQRNTKQIASPPQIQRTLPHANITGEVIPLKQFRDSSYIGEIGLGSPLQNFSVIFDSGSANIWVPSAECESEFCRQSRKFEWQNSTSFKEGGWPFTVKYATGQVFGRLAKDTLKVGNVTLPGLDIGLVSRTPGNTFVNTGFDGVFGLAFPALSTTKVTPPIQLLMKRQLIKYPLVSLYLNETVINSASLTEKTNSQGELIIGGMNSRRISDKFITWFPVKSDSYWQISLNQFQIGSKVLKAGQGKKSASAIAVIDSGTNLITMPVKMSQRINALIKAKHQSAGLYTVDCQVISSLPIVSIELEGVKFYLKPLNYIVKIQDTCFSAFTGLDLKIDSKPAYILGNAFARAHYIIYDYGGKRVGLAKSKHT